MQIPSFLAVLLEHGASTTKGDQADPRLIRYQTSIYPEDAGIELLVNDIEDFRLLARLVEPRLAVLLTEYAIGMDCGLASKASEGGKMINNLQRERNPVVLPKTTQNPEQEFDNMNYSVSKQQDFHNKNY